MVAPTDIEVRSSIPFLPSAIILRKQHATPNQASPVVSHRNQRTPVTHILAGCNHILPTAGRRADCSAPKGSRVLSLNVLSARIVEGGVDGLHQAVRFSSELVASVWHELSRHQPTHTSQVLHHNLKPMQAKQRPPVGVDRRFRDIRASITSVLFRLARGAERAAFCLRQTPSCAHHHSNLDLRQALWPKLCERPTPDQTHDAPAIHRSSPKSVIEAKFCLRQPLNCAHHHSNQP